jgi:hypothetical protein
MSFTIVGKSTAVRKPRRLSGSLTDSMVQALRITQWVIGNFPNSKPISATSAPRCHRSRHLPTSIQFFRKMVAFSDRDWQLEQYLDTMKEAGLSEAFLPMLQGEGDGRLHAHAVAIGVLAKPTAKLGRRGQRRRAGAARRPRCRSSQKEIGGGPVQRSGRMRRRRLARAEQPKRALTRLLTRTNDSF